MSYPRDEFDEVDEQSARRGTYRSVNVDPAKSVKGAIPLVAAGVGSLVVGAAMYVYAPRTATPQYTASSPSSSAASTSASSPASARSSAPVTSSAPTTPSAPATPSVPATSPVPPSPTVTLSQSAPAGDVSVGVFNASAPSGSASGAAAKLSGYTINETANYTAAAPAASVVYYAQGYQDQAQSIAATLNIAQSRQATSAVPMGNHKVIVVLASDYAG